MESVVIQTGVVHDIPDDLYLVLEKDQSLLEIRNTLTPLARNDRICRVTTVKKQETREKHISKLIEDISNGKKRPCCRPGCPHRNEKAKKRFK